MQCWRPIRAIALLLQKLFVSTTVTKKLFKHLLFKFAAKCSFHLNVCGVISLHLPPTITGRITESENCLGWKRPLRSSSPTINLALPSPPLNHVPKRHVCTCFKYLQGWWLHHFPGQPMPVLYSPFCEEIFHNLQSKPPLVHFEAFSPDLLPVTWEKRPTATSLQPPFR